MGRLGWGLEAQLNLPACRRRAASHRPSLPISTTQLGALVLGLPWQRVGHTGAITLV